MGEILGIGVTHYPGLIQPDEADGRACSNRTLNSDQVPEALKDPARWPEPMRKEWADPVAAAKEHRRRLVGGFRKAREALDAFNPDFVVIWGDDQYENFREDGVPSFCVFACDEIESRPYARDGRRQRQCLGRGRGHRVPHKGPSRRRLDPGGQADRGRLRRQLRLPHALRERAAARLHQHDPLSRLRPRRASPIRSCRSM